MTVVLKPKSSEFQSCVSFFPVYLGHGIVDRVLYPFSFFLKNIFFGWGMENILLKLGASEQIWVHL